MIVCRIHISQCAWGNAKDVGEIPVFLFAWKFSDRFVELLGSQNKSLRCVWFKILMQRVSLCYMYSVTVGFGKSVNGYLRCSTTSHSYPCALPKVLVEVCFLRYILCKLFVCVWRWFFGVCVFGERPMATAVLTVLLHRFLPFISSYDFMSSLKQVSSFIFCS